MSRRAFTPGPWSVICRIPKSPKKGGGTNFGFKIQRGRYSTEVTVEGDAYLIAKAPEMYRTLTNMVFALKIADLTAHPAYARAMQILSEIDGDL